MHSSGVEAKSVFQSKTEAYTFALWQLHTLRKIYPDLGSLQTAIENSKVAIENHVQDPKIIIGYLENAKNSLKSADVSTLSALQNKIAASRFKQTEEEKFSTILGRRFESEFSLQLLFHPTKAMMESVQAISKQIVALIQKESKSQPMEFARLLPWLADTSNPISYGGFQSQPSYQEVIDILNNNDPQQLSQIMHIHFMFANIVSKYVKNTVVSSDPPQGRLAEVVALAWPKSPSDSKLTDFQYGLQTDDNTMRRYIADVHFYNADLYMAPGGRGRGRFDLAHTNQLGLMLPNQEVYSADLPTSTSTWVADCRTQKPNYDSAYVVDLIENDAVYVAGPSGMASLLFGQMEMLANFQDVNLKKNYLSAVVAYIVAPGFHSLHEVIGPAQDRLSLVPGYEIHVPRLGKLAPPPNYSHFFSQQAKIDLEFANLREKAWGNYLAFFNNTYAPRNIPGFVKNQAVADKMSEEKHPIENTATLSLLINEVKSFIGKVGKITAQGEIKLNFTGKLFGNRETTYEQIEKAKHLLELAQMNDKIRFNEFVNDYINIEKSKIPDATKSKFFLCLKKLEKILQTEPLAKNTSKLNQTS